MLMVVYLQGDEDRVCLASYSYDNGALLHGFRGIFDLEDTSLRRTAGIVSIAQLAF